MDEASYDICIAIADINTYGKIFKEASLSRECIYNTQRFSRFRFKHKAFISDDKYRF